MRSKVYVTVPCPYVCLPVRLSVPSIDRFSGGLLLRARRAGDRWKEASMPKTSSIHAVISIQYRLLTDRQTGGHMMTANTTLSVSISADILYNGPSWAYALLMQTLKIGRNRFWFLHARCHASSGISYCLIVSVCVCMSVCHKSEFYRNACTNRAGFWYGSFLPPVLHCVKRKFGYFEN